MAFDPDAYLSQSSDTGGFDPDAYLSSLDNEPITPTTPKPSLVRPQRGEHPARKYLRSGLVTGMLDPVRGAAQLLDKSLPESVSGALNAGDQWLYENTEGLLGTDQPTYTDALRAEEAAYQAQRQAEGETGFDADRLAGNIITTAIPATKAASALKAIGGGAKSIGAIIGGATGLTTPALSDNYAKEKAAQLVTGEIGGAAFPAVAQGLSRVIMPNAASNPALQNVLAEGGKPTIGQALGGRWNVAEEKLASVPILGDMINIARTQAKESVIPAAYNRVLKQIGEKMPSNLSGRDAAVYVNRTLKDKYEDVLNKIGAVTPDNTFNQRITDLDDMVSKMLIPQASKDKFAFAMDSVKSAMDNNGVMTSEAFKRAESALGSYAKKLGGSQDIYDDALSPAVIQLKEELKDMLSRQAGTHAKELKKVNKAWANYKITERAGSGIGAQEGNFSPAQLLSGVRASDKSKDHSKYFKGEALMQDLAESFKTVIGDKTPNSFTTDRGLLTAGALGGYTVNPAIPLSLLAGGAMYTRPIQNALVGAVARRPQGAQALASRINALSEGMVVPSGMIVAPIAANSGLDISE